MSTTRFAGMLILGREKYAVYDIGDGHVEWQVRAEGSLFYWHYGQMETRADGMIFLCKDECRTEVAQNIIRQTMWNRKQLLSDASETCKPVRWSRSPIKLRAQHDHVYLMTYGDFGQSLLYLWQDELGGYSWPEGAQDLHNPAYGDYEIETDRRYRCFCNPATDLLKYVYFFSAVKRLMHNIEKGIPTSGLNYALRCRKRDFPILRMYPDVVTSERVKIYQYHNQ